MTPLRFLRSALLILVPFVPASVALAQDEPPRSLDPRLKIELFAENPQIVTPTGIDVDHAGRVWAIESNTHFPPEGYQGHPTDRVLVMEDTTGDRKADKTTVFRDGLTHTMSIALKPVWLDIEPANVARTGSDAKPISPTPTKPLAAFIATRREILICTDTDGDLKCDETKQLVHLETKGNYPHNGLAGFAFDALGNMFFGFGENLGADYKIIGSDGTTLSGGGEGGNVYRCRPDGSKLERWATGFWNPHASCFDAFGRLFTLDNDPDSRPPCRLLHIIPGGDYGYRFRNGRKGTHPFTSWNGEIPGTLPMVSGTGEAPSGIVCYESDGFPEDYLGTLLVGSWGDHRIDKFVLKPRGASFESLPQPVIKGGENFRPVGLALAPDGSLYVTDWVLKDYKLHGKGRVWRVSAKDEPKRTVVGATTIQTAMPDDKLQVALASSRIDLRRMAAKTLIQDGRRRAWVEAEASKPSFTERMAIECMWAGVSWDWPKDEILAPVNWVKAVDGTRQNVHAAAEQVRHYFVFPSQESQAEPFLRPESVIEAIQGLPTPITDWQLVVGLLGHFLPRANELAVLDGPGLDDPFVFAVVKSRVQHMLDGNERQEIERWFRSYEASKYPRMRLLVTLAAKTQNAKHLTILSSAIANTNLSVRRAVVQWIGEENLTELRPEVEKVLASEPMTGDLFMACLASLSMLDGVPPAEFEKAPPVQHILPIVKDAQRSPSLRAIALRMLPPTLKELDGKLLGELVASTDEGLRREAVRTLGQSPIPEREALLRTIAADESLDANLRADAVAGLAGVDHHAKLNDATRDLLVKLLRDKNNAIAVEAIRSLRSAVMAKQDQSASDPKVAEAMKQFDVELKVKEPGDSRSPLREAVAFAFGQSRVGTAHQKPTAEDLVGDAHPTGDAAAGRRVFFHTNSAGCFRCHTVGGRGGQVGPDLTVIARTMDRQKLAESILEPSKEISPQFTTWAVETTSGKVLTGMLLGEEVNGDLRLGDNTGKIFFVPFKEIETRQPMKASIMPDKLHEQLTPTEFRDLVAYLETLK